MLEDIPRLLGEQQLATVAMVATEVDRDLGERLQGLKTMAQFITPEVMGNAAALQTFLQDRPIMQIYFNGGLFVTGRDGTVLASLPVSLGRIGVNYLDRDHIATALRESRTTISAPFIGKRLKGPAFGVATPIHDARGLVTGTLVGVIDLSTSNFLDWISENKYGKTGNFFLAAMPQRLIISSPSKNSTLESLPAPGAVPTLDQFVQGYEGSAVYVDPSGVEQLVSGKRLSNAQWTLFASVPTQEAFAPIEVMRERMLRAILALSLLASALTWWTVRRELMPLRKAAGTLATWADSHQPVQPLVIARHDEVGQLIASFNGLLHTLSQREDALRESEFRWKFAIDGTGDALWDWNVPENRLFVSSQWHQMLGYADGELGNDLQEWEARIHPEDKKATLEALQQHLDGRAATYICEYRLRKKDGSYLWLHDRGAVVSRSQDGAALRVIGTHADITERRANQMQLRLAEQVFRQSREAIMVADAQGNTIMVNKAFSEITGYAEADVIGENPRILTSGRHDPEFYRAMWEAIATQGHWEGEIWNRKMDGSVYPGWLSISTMRGAQGETTHYVGSFTDLTTAKDAESRIQLLSYFDSLTGLPNRTQLKDRAVQALNMVQRAGESLTMLLVSIDGFHSFNDTVGHSASDALLVELSQRLRASVREQDTVARLGSREFLLVLPGTNSDGAAHLAAELQWKLAQPCQLGAHELNQTVSIGVACFPEDGIEFDTLLKSVTIAMHRAQANGGDSSQFYSAEMSEQLRQRDLMLKALRHAAELDQLQLLYQPLVDLRTGQISGMEALLRWHHPELGDVAPAQFIPVAEESGLIQGIGSWILRRACRDLRHWLDKGLQIPHVAVNVSPRQFQEADFVAQVTAILVEFRIDPALICVELTETALMEESDRSEAMLKALKELGVKLSLDDFGTGYSSLSYLKRFPFDKVKIDQSFVRDVTHSQSDLVLVKVIVSMAHGLGMRVVAEGVETRAQCEIMSASVCDEIQGYYFSRPVDAPSIEVLFAEGRQLRPEMLHQHKPQPTLLLVDDEPNIVAALKRLFRRDGYAILTANSGAQGLEVLANNRVDVIISDQRMPGMTGVEFLRTAKISYPDTIRIVLSGYTELQSVTDAINEGAVYRFLTKPWDDEQLSEHIHKAFEHQGLLEENRQLDIKIRRANQELVAANRQLGEVLDKTRQQVERDGTSLGIVREVLQHMPMPVIGVDDEGLMAFVNIAAQQLFRDVSPLLGTELTDALPELQAAISLTAEGDSCPLIVRQTPYQVTWNSMGIDSRSRGKIVTLMKKEVSA
jgi:diguanylate cyclase (GGDEF)-like protein/PAS domain S-box-containing protein